MMLLAETVVKASGPMGWPEAFALVGCAAVGGFVAWVFFKSLP